MQTNISRTILVTEDNPTNLKLVRDILESQGYKILEAMSGADAIKSVKENKEKISLILMDLQLPDINGLDVIKTLKSDTTTKKIPIIVVSAYAMEKDIENALKAGCDDYITKPINLVSFIARVNSFFDAVRN